MISLERMARVTAAAHAAFRTAQVELSFDKTNPEAERWARERAAQLIRDVSDTTRDAVRAVVGKSFKDGIPPRQSAKLIKPLVGLTERDAIAVMNARYDVIKENLRLKDGDIKPGKVIEVGGRSIRMPKGGVSLEVIDKLARDYADRLLSKRAFLIARTETIAASNEGQRQLWAQAQADGLLPSDVLRTWITTYDDRTCPTCSGMDGQIRSLGQPFDAGLFGEVMGPPAHPACRCAQGISPKTGAQQTRAEVIAQPSDAYPAFHPEAFETLNRYQRGGAFTAARTRLHNAIVEDHFVGKKPVKKPVVTVLGGGPAAGKSTLTSRIKLPKNSIHIDVDQVRTMLPEYREGLVRKNTDISTATHEESSLIAKRIARESVSGRYHMLMDGAGNSSFDSIKSKVDGYRKSGAKVVGKYVTVDTDVAVQRMLDRGAQAGRFVPESYLREVHKSISSTLPRVMREGLFDEVELWDTTSGVPVKVASAIGDQLTIHDESLWKRFLAKAHQ